MRAIVQEGYGPPDMLRLEDVDRPVAEDKTIVVRVQAASLNVLDWRRVRGTPLVVRFGEGLRRPKRPVLGVDTAGTVEAVGKDVTHVSPGQEVFGIGQGAFAEYTVGDTFAPKPANLSLEQAAALPVAGLTALQAVRDIGKVQVGERVLVNGAGGGVGTFTVQTAKAFGAHVTATTTTAKLDLVRSLGASEVIDYTREDFRGQGKRYDVIIEVGGRLTLPGCRSALTKNGRLILVGAGSGPTGPMGRFIAGALRAKVLKQPVAAFVSWETTEDLLTLKDLIESEKVAPVIDKTYVLSDTPEALHYLESGQVRGKVIITI